jgi:predicted TPR repeat methyltransferase
MKNSTTSGWLDKVYNSQNDKELAEVYNGWAEQYDEDLSHFGYRLPTVVIGLAGRYITHNEFKILDAGAGTGLLGEVLALMGYEDITAIDLSPGMLEVARAKKAYRTLRQMRLGESLDFADNTFDAVVSSGTFTVGHAPPRSFDELIRITRPKGHVIFSIRSDGDNGDPFVMMQETLEKAGAWRLVEITEAFKSLPLKEPEVENQVFVYRVL